MAVADRRFFSVEHLNAHRFNASAELAEQAVHCLELVSELVEAGLNFQFKGGNSLLLILGEPKRFSIDVDIATDCPRENLDGYVSKVVADHGVFTRWEKRQHKTKPWLPLASYYLFYRSAIADGAETSIMLDIQLRRSPYRTQMRSVSCGDVYTSDSRVELPVPASIIGDKLLTLGPNTLGIPVGKGKEAQRLKHVFDVSRLLSTSPEISLVRESFDACLKHENDLQDRARTTGEVLVDTLDFCGSVASHASVPDIASISSEVLIENVRGLKPFAGHLFEAGYGWSDLRRDMARVALCTAAIGNPQISDYAFLEALNGPDPDSAAYWKIVQSWMKDLQA